jgi:hypothetical protein
VFPLRLFPALSLKRSAEAGKPSARRARAVMSSGPRPVVLFTRWGYRRPLRNLQAGGRRPACVHRRLCEGLDKPTA